MAYDTWENIGYQVIDKLNRFDTTLHNIEESLKRTEAKQSAMDTKLWTMGIGATILATLGAKFLGV